MEPIVIKPAEEISVEVARGAIKYFNAECNGVIPSIEKRPIVISGRLADLVNVLPSNPVVKVFEEFASKAEFEAARAAYQVSKKIFDVESEALDSQLTTFQEELAGMDPDAPVSDFMQETSQALEQRAEVRNQERQILKQQVDRLRASVFNVSAPAVPPASPRASAKLEPVKRPPAIVIPAAQALPPARRASAAKDASQVGAGAGAAKPSRAPTPRGRGVSQGVARAVSESGKKVQE